LRHSFAVDQAGGRQGIWFSPTFYLQAALVAGRRTALHRALARSRRAIGLAVIISGGMATPYRMAELAAQGRLEAAMPPGAATASLAVRIIRATPARPQRMKLRKWSERA